MVHSLYTLLGTTRPTPRRKSEKTHSIHRINTRNRLLLLALSVCLGGIVALVDDEVLGLVVLLSGEVRLEDRLGAGSVTLLTC